MPNKEVDLLSFNNSWFETGGSIIKRGLWYIVNVLFFLNPLMPVSGIKVFLLRIFGTKVGQNVILKPSINIKYPWKLTIGNNVWIGEGVWIDNLANITIQDNVCISQGAMLLTGNHNYTQTTFDLMIKPIILEDGVWIGAKALVCPGVTCGSHAVLSVKSVATKDLEAFNIYQGNPATKVKQRIIL